MAGVSASYNRQGASGFTVSHQARKHSDWQNSKNQKDFQVRNPTGGEHATAMKFRYFARTKGQTIAAAQKSVSVAGAGSQQDSCHLGQHGKAGGHAGYGK